MTRPGSPIDELLTHAGWLRGLALRLAADTHRTDGHRAEVGWADDAVQDTLLQALRHPPDDPTRTRGFLGTTLRNVLAGRRRSEQRRARHERRAGEGAEQASASAAELVERAELHQALGRLVLELPEPQREIVLRRHQHDEDVTAIAAATGLSPDAVRAHLRRARATLRRQLERSDPDLARTFAGLTASVGALLRGLPEFAGTATRSTTHTPIGQTTISLTTIGLMNAKLWTILAVTAAAVLAWTAWPLEPDPGSGPVARPGEARPPLAGAAPAPGTGLVTRPATGEPEVPTRGAVVAELAKDFVRDGRLVGLVPAAPIDAPLGIRFDGRVDGVKREYEAKIPVQPDGRFRLVLPSWAHDCEHFDLRIDFHGLWYADLTRRFEGELQRDASELLLEVQPVGIVTGRVVDGDGEPEVAARIVAVDPDRTQIDLSPRSRTNTGAEGNFLLKVPMEGPALLLALPMHEASISGIRLMQVRPLNEQELVADSPIADARQHRDDLSAAAATHSVRIGEHLRIPDWVLHRPSEITGRVVDARGAALPGLAVTWLPQEGERWGNLDRRNFTLWSDGVLGRDCEALPDHDGGFTLRATAGRPGVCFLHTPGGQQRLPWLDAVPATAPSDLEFRLDRAVTVRVQQGGEPVRNFAVQFRGNARDESLSLRTDDAGELRLWLPLLGATLVKIERSEHATLEFDAREADENGLLVIDLDD